MFKNTLLVCCFKNSVFLFITKNVTFIAQKNIFAVYSKTIKIEQIKM